MTTEKWEVLLGIRLLGTTCWCKLSYHQAASAQMHLVAKEIVECRPLLGQPPLALYHPPAAGEKATGWLMCQPHGARKRCGAEQVAARRIKSPQIGFVLCCGAMVQWCNVLLALPLAPRLWS